MKTPHINAVISPNSPRPFPPILRLGSSYPPLINPLKKPTPPIHHPLPHHAHPTRPIRPQHTQIRAPKRSQLTPPRPVARLLCELRPRGLHARRERVFLRGGGNAGGEWVAGVGAEDEGDLGGVVDA
jgi:hypothetical protein